MKSRHPANKVTASQCKSKNRPLPRKEGGQLIHRRRGLEGPANTSLDDMVRVSIMEFEKFVP